MSSPPPPLFLQKPLQWLQRWLYGVASGPIPFPAPVIEVGQDWPLELERINPPTVVVGAGVTPINILTLSEADHALITTLSIFKSNAGVWAAAEAGTFVLTQQSLAVPLIQAVIAGFDLFPLVNALSNFQTGAVHTVGLDTLYVPPGGKLDWNHTSTAGGDTLGALGFMLRRPKSFPLRLP